MRVALINVQGADETLLSEALTKAYGEEVQVKSFSQETHGDQAVQNSATFLLKRTADKKLTGVGNRIILSGDATDQDRKMAGKLEKTGLAISTVKDRFDSQRSADDQKSWVEAGAYPASEADNDNDYSFLFSDDDDVSDAAPVTESRPEPIPMDEPEPVRQEQAPRQRPGIPLDGGDEEIPLPGSRPVPVSAPEPAPASDSRTQGYRSIPADSMSPNDGPVTRSNRVIPVESGPELPSYVEDDDLRPRSRRASQIEPIEEDDEPAPLPRRTPPAPRQDREQPASIPVDDFPAKDEATKMPSWRDFQAKNADQGDDDPAPLPSRRSQRPSIPVDFDDAEEAPVAPAPRLTAPPAPVSVEPDEDYAPAPLPRRQEQRPVAPAPVNVESDEEYAPAPLPRRQAQAPEYRQEQRPAPSYQDDEEYAPAPLPRRQEQRPVTPVPIDDPMDYDESRRPAPQRDWSPAPSRGMEDEIDLSQIQATVQENEAQEDERRRDNERRRQEEADARNRLMSPEPTRREGARNPGSDRYYTPGEDSDQRDEVNDIPEVFRSRRNVLEEEALGTQEERPSRAPRSMLDEMRAEFGSTAGRFTPASESAFIIYITGARGGAGKTSLAYLMAQVLASACKKAGNGEEVYLVEGDYENPKLASRFGLDRNQNLGELARFYETIQSDRSLPGGNGSRFEVDATVRNIIDKITYKLPDSGLNVLACPYDLTTRKSTTIRLAMQRAITQVSKTARYIIIDGDTLSNDDVLDRELIAKAHHTVIVAWGNSDEDMGDGIRAAHTLKTAVASGGMGIPAKRVSMFFNRTSYAKVEEIKVKIRPTNVSGYLPDLPEFQDTWIGSVQPSENFHNAVACVAKAANTIYPNPDLVPFANRQVSRSAPGVSAKRKGRFGFLRNRG